MKTRTQRTGFTPFDLVLTVESEAELLALYAITLHKVLSGFAFESGPASFSTACLLKDLGTKDYGIPTEAFTTASQELDKACIEYYGGTDD